MFRTTRTLLLFALCCLSTSSALAASKRVIAAVGGEVPGGGLFAGPSFTSWPSAAGDGWAVFRSTLEGGTSAEAIVAAHFTTPVTRVQIARLGQRVDGAGSIRDFLGRPSISPNGDVAFLASFRPTEGAARIGIFYFDHAPSDGLDNLRLVVQAGDASDAGALDFTTRVDPGVAADADDTPDRTVAVNASGQIAFSAATADGGAAVFRHTPGSALAIIAKRGDPFGDATFTAFGSPAINSGGAVAFHATLDGADDSTDSSGIFLHNGTALSRKVARGIAVTASQSNGDPVNAILTEFGNAVTLNDGGDIGFTGGPMGGSCDPAAEIEYAAGVYRNGVTSLVGYPTQSLTLGRVTGVRLGTAGDSLLAPPSIAPNGSATVFVSISDGAVEALRRVNPPYGPNDATKIAVLGGQSPDQAPTGSAYRGLLSAPAVDANGAVAFFARLAGGTSPSAVIYQPINAAASAIPQSDPAPISGSGFFSGPAFSAPFLTDAGDVIFKAYVARGQTSIGIFQAHFDVNTGATTLTRLVGAGDDTPTADGVLLDLVGDPAVAPDGTVVFAALASNDHGRGIYRVAPNGTLSRIVERGNPAPGGGTFGSVSIAPAINANGDIAFRAGVRSGDPDAPAVEGLFLANDRGITTQVLASDPLGTAQFLKLRDPGVSALPSIAFRATIGTVPGQCQPATDELSGLFLSDGTSVLTVGLEHDDLGGGVLISDFVGTPAFSTNGDMVFQVARVRDGSPAGSTILRQRSGAGNHEDVVAVGVSAPAGGTFKSLGAPSVSPGGRVAFRGAVDGGGVSGLFVTGENGIQPYVALNETTDRKSVV